MIEQTVVNRRYRVDRPIGEGGMAVVFRGHDLLLGRDVAIKALRPQYAADATFRARFEREAQAAAAFSHPNIIDIYDVGEEDGTPYIVMAYVRGHSLKEIVAAEAPFHPDDVAALLEQICAALDYAHERGYVHRDVKPQNILVDERGLARVVDFGIAKGLADSDLTEVGTGLGTVHYLSPEQASGLMATPASDVYSAGVVAFEMLTGRLPFEADSPIGVAMRHVHDAPPPPSALDPRVPPAVDNVILRALVKDPTRRYPSAGAFARAITRWREVAPASRGAVPAPAAPETEATNGSDGRDAEFRAKPGRPLAAAAAPVGQVRAAQPLRQPTPRTASDGDQVGCATWAVGTGILLALIGLVWLGFRVSEGFEVFGGDDPAGGVARPTATADDVVDVPGIVPAPEGQPTIEPATETVPAGPQAVVVPQLIGLDQDAAAATANNRGLLVSVAGEEASDEIPPGLVAAQEPRAEAQAPQGSTVEVRLSAGSNRVDLAALQLVGRGADEAEALLRERGLGVERVETASADVPDGSVVAVEPADAARTGSTVTLRVSVGDRVRVPPEIQGQPLDLVERQLTELGLVVRDRLPVDQATIESFDIDLATAAIDDGDIVGVQGPEGIDFGVWVPRGTEVDLVFFDRGQDGP